MGDPVDFPTLAVGILSRAEDALADAGAYLSRQADLDALMHGVHPQPRPPLVQRIEAAADEVRLLRRAMNDLPRVTERLAADMRRGAGNDPG